MDADLDAFTSLCRALYYEQSPTASRQVNDTLRSLPSDTRAVYAKRMSDVRAQFHRDKEMERRSQAVALLAGTRARSGTRHARHAALKAFLRTHCSRNMPGPHPFLISLCSVLYLLTRSAEQGGAGRRCIDWTVEMEVFTESGGHEWLVDSIALLKGTLCFDERPTKGEEGVVTRADGLSATDARIEGTSPPADRVQGPPPSIAGINGISSPTVIELHHETSPPSDSRVFTNPPWMTQPELASLVALFPNFISQPAKRVRFAPIPERPMNEDEESMIESFEVEARDSTRSTTKLPGHGSICLSHTLRIEDYRGTLWERILLWLRTLLGI